MESVRVAPFVATTLATFLFASAAAAQPAPPTTEPTPPPTTAIFAELGAAFVPVANDIPLMLGGGVRFAKIHEVWARGGFIATGDDVRLGFGVAGYRVVLRPGRIVRPTFGAIFAGLPETCTHDAAGAPSCTKVPLFIFAATAGVRIEPTPWFGVAGVLTLGTDSYPNPFGMFELLVTFTYDVTSAGAR